MLAEGPTAYLVIVFTLWSTEWLDGNSPSTCNISIIPGQKYDLIKKKILRRIKIILNTNYLLQNNMKALFSWHNAGSQNLIKSTYSPFWECYRTRTKYNVMYLGSWDKNLEQESRIPARLEQSKRLTHSTRFPAIKCFSMGFRRSKSLQYSTFPSASQHKWSYTL